MTRPAPDGRGLTIPWIRLGGGTGGRTTTTYAVGPGQRADDGSGGVSRIGMPWLRSVCDC